MTPHPPNRREFLQVGVTGLAAAGLINVASGQQAGVRVNEQGIPLRPFGRHRDELVTLICLGGHHTGRNQDENADIKLIQQAIDEGITFLDNAWDYHDGGSEERMGKALEQGKLRDQVFLMTKVCARDAKTAQEQLDQSLRRLRTDHLDLWQFHEINYGNDPDWIFEAGGAIEVGLKAKEQGKIRYLGFTGHKDPMFHLKMLEMPYDDWDSVQMPLNVMDGTYRSFQKLVLPKLLERGIAPIGMKKPRRRRIDRDPGRSFDRGRAAIRLLAADHDPGQRHRVARGARAEPQDRPRLHPDDRGGARGPGAETPACRR